MSFGTDLKRRVKVTLAPMIFLCITVYFIWNATQGNRGLVASIQRQDLLRHFQAEEAAARAERDAWATRVAGLRTHHLDPDTLDERARFMKNLADPTDIIVNFSGQDKLF